MGNGLANAPPGSLSEGDISYKHFLFTAKSLETLRGVAGEWWWASFSNELTNACVFHGGGFFSLFIWKIFDSEYEIAKPCFIYLSLLSTKCDLIIGKPLIFDGYSDAFMCFPHPPPPATQPPENTKHEHQGYFNRNALLQWFCNVNTFLL